MDALLYAAGLGTRLRPLTDTLPKALIPVGGIPMLERVARRLIAAGADRIVINTHHFSERIAEFVRERDGFGVDVRISHEPGAPLETGGGLRNAAPLLRADRPFFLHNADILTDLDLRAMYDAHLEASPLATLAVSERSTSRYFLFDDAGLCGHEDRRSGVVRQVRDSLGPIRPLAFGGVHVAAPQLPGMLGEEGAFSIVEPYLRLAAEGHVIRPYPLGAVSWIDIGSPESLRQAEALVSRA